MPVAPRLAYAVSARNCSIALVGRVAEGVDFVFESLDFVVESLDFVVESLDFVVEGVAFVAESLAFVVESFDFVVESVALRSRGRRLPRPARLKFATENLALRGAWSEGTPRSLRQRAILMDLVEARSTPRSPRASRRQPR